MAHPLYDMREVTIVYKVIKKFKYNGKVYNEGKSIQLKKAVAEALRKSGFIA